MAVTEFALVHLSSPLTPQTLQALEEAQRIQDKWALEQNSQLPESRIARGTGMLQRNEDPSAILITARWDSPAAHWEWIGTDENKQAMYKLMPLIVAEGEKKLVLYHVDSVLFPPPGDGATSALGSPVLSIYHYRVKLSEKEGFEDRLKVAMGELNAATATPFRWGWRMEKDGETEELLIVRGWDSEEQRLDFPLTKEHATLGELAGHAIDVNVHSYKKIV